MPPKAKTSVKFEGNPKTVEERKYYATNRRDYYTDCLRVKDRTGRGIAPLTLYPGQMALERLRDEVEEFHQKIADEIGEGVRREPVRVQVLKARRGGFSTDIAAQMFHYCEFNKGKNGLVVAHLKPNANNIAQISRRFQQQFPKEQIGIKIPLVRESDELEWGEVDGHPWDSRIIVATASSRNFARSFDYSFVHLSECAHYESPDAIAAAKDAAQFAEYIYEESTANGMDAYFYKSWQSAMYLHEVKQYWSKNRSLPPQWNGKYKFFWAWWQDEGYHVPLTETQKLRILEDLSELEKEGVQKFKWTPEQIEWRRRKIAGDCSEQSQMDPEDYFRQEYPSSPEEAFVSSGSSVFPTVTLSNMEYNHARPRFHGALKGFDSNGAMLQKAKTERPDNSPFVIWEEPKAQHQYIIGARSAEGLKHTDYSVVIVFDRTNGDFLREVACYRGQATGIELGDVCAWLGFKYHGAYIIPEATRPATAQRLVAKRYPYLYLRKNEERVGNHTTAPTNFVPGFKAQRGLREMILDHAQDAFRREEVMLKSKWCIREHIIYTNIDGERKAPVGETDDGVIAAALAIYAHKQTAPKVVTPEDLREVEMFQDPADAKTLYERSLLEAVAKKKKRSERMNKKRIGRREQLSAAKLKDLFR